MLPNADFEGYHTTRMAVEKKSSGTGNLIILFFRDELTYCDDVIYKGKQVVIPAEIQDFIKSKLHKFHLGINSTIRRAREIVFWP